MMMLIGAILTMGRRTVTGVLWTGRSIASGHFSSYHRVFSRASWSLWPLGKVLATAVLRLIPEGQPVPVAATAGRAASRQVCSKAKLRAAIPITVDDWGLKCGGTVIVVQPLHFMTLGVAGAGRTSPQQNRARPPAQDAGGLARRLMGADHPGLAGFVFGRWGFGSLQAGSSFISIADGQVCRHPDVICTPCRRNAGRTSRPPQGKAALAIGGDAAKRDRRAR
jgi:hypothetical protein